MCPVSTMPSLERRRYPPLWPSTFNPLLLKRCCFLSSMASLSLALSLSLSPQRCYNLDLNNDTGCVGTQTHMYTQHMYTHTHINSVQIERNSLICRLSAFTSFILYWPASHKHSNTLLLTFIQRLLLCWFFISFIWEPLSSSWDLYFPHCLG